MLTVGTAAAAALLMSPRAFNPSIVGLLLLVLALGTAWAWTSSICVNEETVSKRSLGRDQLLRLAEVVTLSAEVEGGVQTIAMLTIRLTDVEGQRLTVRTGWWSGGNALASILRERTPKASQ